MKILVLTGSPHKHGTTATLTDAFCETAIAAGHSITRFDTAFMDIHPCLGCDRCEYGAKPCVWQDDMTKIIPFIEESEMIVFATPLYYFGMSAQMKAVVDRFYALERLVRAGNKLALLISAGNDGDWVMDSLVVHFKAICRYLNLRMMQPVLAENTPNPAALANSDYLDQVKQIAANL